MPKMCETCGGPLVMGSWCVPCGMPALPFRPETIVPLLQIHQRMDLALRDLLGNNGIDADYTEIETFAGNLSGNDPLPDVPLTAKWTFVDRSGNVQHRHADLSLLDLCRTPEELQARREAKKRAEAEKVRKGQVQTELCRLHLQRSELFKAICGASTEGKPIESSRETLLALNATIFAKEEELFRLST